MKIALCQLDIAWEDKAANIAACDRFCREASIQGATIAVFPEMTLVGFSNHVSHIAEPMDGPSVGAMRDIAAKYGIAVIFGTVIEEAGERFNTLIVAGKKGELAHSYRKIHPFSFAHEERFYASGTELVPFEFDSVSCGAVICYDLRFPELFTALAERIKLYFVIANWPDARQEHWNLLLRARALDSLAFVAGVNRVGSGNNLSYAGGSVLVDPWGNEVNAPMGDAPGILVVEPDLAMVTERREHFSLLRDRQPELYRRLSIE